MINLRCQEMDLALCRLALFLDPRYKGLVDDSHGLDGLVTTVCRPFPCSWTVFPQTQSSLGQSCWDGSDGAGSLPSACLCRISSIMTRDM